MFLSIKRIFSDQEDGDSQSLFLSPDRVLLSKQLIFTGVLTNVKSKLMRMVSFVLFCFFANTPEIYFE